MLQIALSTVLLIFVSEVNEESWLEAGLPGRADRYVNSSTHNSW